MDIHASVVCSHKYAPQMGCRADGINAGNSALSAQPGSAGDVLTHQVSRAAGEARLRSPPRVARSGPGGRPGRNRLTRPTTQDELTARRICLHLAVSLFI